MLSHLALALLLPTLAQGSGLVDHAIAGSSLPTYLDSETWTASTTFPGATSPTVIRATVPGDLITDLQLAGLIGDPLYELNWKNFSLWDDNVWTYTQTFTLTPAELSAIANGSGDTLLVFDGVKMSSSMTLNGVALGKTTNQFLRYTFSLAAAVTAGVKLASTNTLAVSFDAADQTTEGRFAACSGGWDWAPYSDTYSQGWGESGPVATRSFTKGIWKSVYTLSISKAAAAITHLVPQVYYNGPFPTAPLTDASHGGFTVRVFVHLWAPGAVSGTVTVAGAWAGATATLPVTLPAGDSAVNLTLAAPPGTVSLWWPSGLGAHPLYAVNATFTAAPGAPPLPLAPFTERHIGFKFVAYVTGNDTDPGWVAANTGGDGNANPQGLMVRANGAPLYVAGANMIPMDMMEGRYSAEAVVRLVTSAQEANMNILRVWGGGIYQSPAFYDTCDALGIMVLHDIMYAQNGHSPKADSPSHKAEIQHQIRRLGHHASLSIVDGCNECHVILNTTTGVYATFVMQTVVDEDQSRVAWPSCPSNGWTAGVDRLSAHPNGSPLGLLPNARPPLPPPSLAVAGSSAAGAPPCTFLPDSDVDGDGVSPSTSPGASAADCCTQCVSNPHCASVVFDPTSQPPKCWFKADGGVPSPRPNRTACINTGHRGKTTIEVHGPYQHGEGWPAVNGGGKQGFTPFSPGYPLRVTPGTPMGPAFPSQFASEFGGSVWSSFESMAPTLAPEHWGIHGGAPPDVCEGGFEADCNGTNVMAQRNYPTDNYNSVYFGDGVDRTAVGAAVFKAQLFQAQLAQALDVAMAISQKRLSNCMGTMIWQLGEIWPTGGWGSIEYATAAFTPGQVLGGRWKPLHYWYRKSLFTRVFATCGGGGQCMVKNDHFEALASGDVALTVTKVSLATGVSTVVYTQPTLSLPPGPGAALFFPIDATISGSDFVLRATVTNTTSGSVMTDNWVPLLPPVAWSSLAHATATMAIAPTPSPDGSIAITLTCDTLCAYVTLTTLAAGRFSDNAFFLTPGTTTVTFIPWGEGQYPLLLESLRMEHMASYL